MSLSLNLNIVVLIAAALFAGIIWVLYSEVKKRKERNNRLQEIRDKLEKMEKKP